MHVSYESSPIVPSARLRTLTALMVNRHLSAEMRQARRRYLHLLLNSSALLLARWVLIALGAIGLIAAIAFATDSALRSGVVFMIGGLCIAGAMMIHPDELEDASDEADSVARGIDELRRQSTLLREWSRHDAPCMLWRESDGLVLALARPMGGESRYCVKCVIMPLEGAPPAHRAEFEALWQSDAQRVAAAGVATSA